MALSNPFPDYPVASLQDKTSSVLGPTIVTDQIQRAREYVQTYARQWQEPKADQRTAKSSIISVQGDYGTGKTFLLLDAISTLHELLAKCCPDYTVLRISCLESDLITWYCLEIGSAFTAEMLGDVMARLYGEAGQRVAAEVRLTEAAVQRLQREPRYIYSLVNENLLNRTAVDQKLVELLHEECKITHEDVCKALTLLLDSGVLGSNVVRELELIF